MLSEECAEVVDNFIWSVWRREQVFMPTRIETAQFAPCGKLNTLLTTISQQRGIQGLSVHCTGEHC